MKALNSEMQFGVWLALIVPKPYPRGIILMRIG